MKNRYFFFKRLYFDCIILFKYKNNYKSIKDDLFVLNYINFKSLKDLKIRNINFIIIDGLEVCYKKTFKNNNYYKYYYQMKIYRIYKQLKSSIVQQKNVDKQVFTSYNIGEIKKKGKKKCPLLTRLQ